MMVGNFLFVVEGEDAEHKIIENIFLKLNYQTHSVKTKDELTTRVLESNGSNIFIIQGPKNRIHNILTQHTKIDSFPVHFNIDKYINKCFIIYGADYNEYNVLTRFFDKFNDENEGILLISNPCIEVLADTVFDTHTGEATKYKLKLREQLLKSNPQSLQNKSVLDYINDNIGELLLNQMKRNQSLFNEPNINLHPQLAINSISNNLPDYEKGQHKFEILLTVLYVSIGHIFDLLRPFDNYQMVYGFIEKWLLNKKIE